MAKLVKEIEVSKELHEAGEAISKLLIKIKEAGADGWQMGTDIPEIVLGSLTDLMTAVQGIDQADEEWREDPKAALNALIQPVLDSLEALLVNKDA